MAKTIVKVVERVPAAWDSPLKAMQKVVLKGVHRCKAERRLSRVDAREHVHVALEHAAHLAKLLRDATESSDVPGLEAF